MLEVAGLRKRFGALVVVEDLSFSVRDGEVLGFMGPNGAGKSTVFDLLAGATAADDGRILLGGRDITRLSPESRVHAGLARAFQVPKPFASLTVREHVRLAAIAGARLHGTAAEVLVDTVLDRTGLAAMAGTPGGRLRLLDRKRLEMARALATRPKVLLLDEVSGGLTRPEVAALVALIADLRAPGLAILWIEHIAHALGAVCDRILMLHLGRSVINDRPDAVMADSRVRTLYLGAAHHG